MSVLISAIIFFSFSNNDLEAPKNAEKIYIYTNQNAENNYLSLGQYLISNDFEIETNRDFYTIGTKEKIIKKAGQNYITLNFSCSDSLIIVKGNFRLGQFSTSTIVNKGMKGSALNKAFLEMQRIALSIPNKTKVEYKIME